ncbi:RNA polymerase I associated factor, A49-like protein [Fimicolochytrium jonesii]|uniref:RNA polymerase I associated factor, A49-like protein n=1 Tax=Fimicolochytrium jonesii TaxID=1396493 RepID=UPI0022FEE4D9|nr:RNA polymerase I associated factor, A49-like protein [Fimicolochytrium jonesii]KAI8816472.1 RNA polymerase I associated factor, A49-like protein [Fimicolochytrium jonesii]
MSQPTKKRKVAATAVVGPAVLDETANVPALVSFPDYPTDPKSVKFQSFVAGQPEAGRKRRRIIVGENQKLEYVGSNTAGKAYCRYIVGVFDKNTKKLTLKEADVFHLSTTVKTLKRHESKHIGEKNWIARNALGEAFGTKKRKQAIRALEKNQVDVGGLSSVADVIKTAIDEKTASMPTREEMREAAKQDRGIPPYDPDAKTPAEVYDINQLCSPGELKALTWKPIWKAASFDEAKQLLAPISPTSWVLERIHTLLQVKTDIVKFQRLLYLAYMMKFYTLKDKALNSKSVAANIGNAPQIVADTFMQRFTEYQSDEGRTKYRISPKLKDTLLAFIIALALSLNDFKLDLSHLAGDMGIGLTRMNKVARELGCRSELKKDETSQQRRWVSLVVPLSFPTKSR